MKLKIILISFFLFFTFFFRQGLILGTENKQTDIASKVDGNETVVKEEAIRIIKPGVFDYQARDFLLRMRAWGVGFPKREQPGYNEAISFAEGMLLGVSLKINIKQEFDPSNLKVVQVVITKGNTDFSREAIAQGIGWHLDKETNRYGPYVLSQLKAKRLNLGVWAKNFNYQQVQSSTSLPTAKLPGLINNRSGFVPSLSYWVTSFGRIHRPGCSFYQRGRGTLTTKPQGVDCRICGGKTPKK